MSTSEASKKIVDFLTRENRPYSFNEIFERCGKEFGKSAFQKALDGVVGRGDAVVQNFGKIKIYYVKQSRNPIEAKKELQLTMQKLAKAQSDLKRKQNEFRELEPKLRTLSSQRNISSLEEQRKKLYDEVHELRQKLQRQETRQAETKYTPAKAKEIEKRYDDLSSTYRKRKRICNDMLEAIMEGYPKSKKMLIEDIGLETDEEFGFKLNPNYSI